MRRSISTIVGFGIVTAIFMAVMSMFYLQQIPTKADARRLEEAIRQEHGLFLTSVAPIGVDVVRPDREGDRTGLAVTCTLRPDVRKRPRTAELYLGRIAESVLVHPDWRGKIGYVTVRHAPPLDLAVTRRAAGGPAAAK